MVPPKGVVEGWLGSTDNESRIEIGLYEQQAVKDQPTTTVHNHSPDDLEAALFGPEPDTWDEDNVVVEPLQEFAPAQDPADPDFQAAFDRAVQLLGDQEANKLLNAIQETTNGEGHKLIAQCLLAELDRHQGQTTKQFLWRWKVIDRLQALLATEAVQNGAAQIPDTLKPGWPYILTYQQIIDAGVELRQAIDDAPPF